MSKAVYWQTGESLDYRNTSDRLIEAGTIIPMETRIGVAACTARLLRLRQLAAGGAQHLIFPQEQQGAVFHHRRSVEILKDIGRLSVRPQDPKTGTAEIPMGAYVYFDGAGITDTKEAGAGADTEASGMAESEAPVKAGYAAAAAAADARVIKVKLLG